MVFAGLFLWLEPLTINRTSQNTLNITLTQPHTQPTAPPKLTAKPKPAAETEIKPKTETVTSPRLKQSEPVKQQPKQEPKPTSEPIDNENQSNVTISTGQILSGAKSLTDVQITDEFKAASEANSHQPGLTVHDPYADIPYLPIKELAVDMNFYSAGYRGDIERFFDKVILTKTFTTKYGTKINCALAVIVVCGWK